MSTSPKICKGIIRKNSRTLSLSLLLDNNQFEQHIYVKCALCHNVELEAEVNSKSAD